MRSLKRDIRRNRPRSEGKQDAAVRQAWNRLPATTDQLRRLRDLARRTGRTFTVPVTRGTGERRLVRAAEGMGRHDLPPERSRG